MRLVQFKTSAGSRQVGVVSEDGASLRVLKAITGV